MLIVAAENKRKWETRYLERRIQRSSTEATKYRSEIPKEDDVVTARKEAQAGKLVITQLSSLNQNEREREQMKQCNKNLIEVKRNENRIAW